jgi:hypothetical protein
MLCQNATFNAFIANATIQCLDDRNISSLLYTMSHASMCKSVLIFNIHFEGRYNIQLHKQKSKEARKTCLRPPPPHHVENCFKSMKWLNYSE